MSSESNRDRDFRRCMALSLGTTLLCLGLLLTGCNSHRHTKDPEVMPTHRLTRSFVFDWIHEAFYGHDFLRLYSASHRPGRLPGHALVELMVERAEPEALVREEILRIHENDVQPDTRLKTVTYLVHGLRYEGSGVLLGIWRKGTQGIRWRVPEGDPRTEEALGAPLL